MFLSLRNIYLIFSIFVSICFSILYFYSGENFLSIKKKNWNEEYFIFESGSYPVSQIRKKNILIRDGINFSAKGIEIYSCDCTCIEANSLNSFHKKLQITMICCIPCASQRLRSKKSIGRPN